MNINVSPKISAGFLQDACEFFIAAEFLLNQNSRVFLPKYFLLSRSIELSLKAYLLGSGVSEKELSSRNSYGHDLIKLLEAACKRGLHDYVVLDNQERGVVELLSYEYLNTRLGYRNSADNYRLPLIEVTEEVARKLVIRLAEFCTSSNNFVEKLA